MTAEPVVPVRVRCLPSQPLSPEGVLRILVCQPGRDLRGADSLRALTKFTRADTTTRSVVRQSSRHAVDTAKQTLFGVAFWRDCDTLPLLGKPQNQGSTQRVKRPIPYLRTRWACVCGRVRDRNNR